MNMEEIEIITEKVGSRTAGTVNIKQYLCRNGRGKRWIGRDKRGRLEEQFVDDIENLKRKKIERDE